MNLTPKQKKFCQYYASCGNATESAIKAGYSKKTAKVIGAENLSKPYLQDYIRSLTIKDEEKRIMTIEERQEWLTKIIKGEIKEKIGVVVNDEYVEGDATPKLDTLLKASEQLNKMQGAYLDRVDITTNKERIKIVSDLKDERD